MNEHNGESVALTSDEFTNKNVETVVGVYELYLTARQARFIRLVGRYLRKQVGWWDDEQWQDINADIWEQLEALARGPYRRVIHRDHVHPYGEEGWVPLSDGGHEHPHQFDVNVMNENNSIGEIHE